MSSGSGYFERREACDLHSHHARSAAVGSEGISLRDECSLLLAPLSKRRASMSDTGGEEVVKQSRGGSGPPRRQQSELIHDQDCTPRVTTFLLAHQIPALRRVQVQATGGSVILQGTLRSFYQKQLCMNCCRHVAGVIEVVDRLAVVSAAENPLQWRVGFASFKIGLKAVEKTARRVGWGRSARSLTVGRRRDDFFSCAACDTALYSRKGAQARLGFRIAPKPFRCGVFRTFRRTTILFASCQSYRVERILTPLSRQSIASGALRRAHARRPRIAR